MCDNRPKTKYIYDLPYSQREDLCRILDLHDKWKTLGGLMKFSVLDIQCLENLERRGKSPSDELLTKWSLQNHTVQELFVLLSRMNHFQAMSILKPFVDPKYHQLMFEGEESWTKLLLDGNNCTPGEAQHLGKNVSANGPYAAAQVNNMTDVGHNLNVMLPESQKINKPGFSDKIQNIGSPISLEENGRQPGADSPTPQTPGTALSPPAFIPAGSRFGATGQPQLSPVGMAALSSIPMGQHPFDLRATSIPQRKLSDGSMVTMPSEYQSVLPMPDYKELEAATNGWNPANILGKGGFGTVFKGVWKYTDVAVKRIELPKGDSRESEEIQFQQTLRELQVLQKIRHENILQLYGVSFNGNQPCLVYQFMEKGSLEDRLQCRNRSSPLTWLQRYNISKGAARGLQYLHTAVQDKPLIHGDIKSANILLDANFEPRIGDFGLAREGPQTHYTHMKVSRVHGTRPYLPDEFLRSKKLSTKVDTYSFGVVLFELATGLRAFDDKRVNKYLKDEVTNHKNVLLLMDPKVNKDPITFSHLIDLGKCCVSKLPKDRPEMKMVCQTLDQLASSAAQVTPRELQEMYDKLHEKRRPSFSNSAQPGSGQPQVSVSRNPALSSSHPQMCPPISGPPSIAVNIPVPVKGGTQVGGYFDSGHPSGNANNNLILSKPSNQHAIPQQTVAVTHKQIEGVMTAGTSIGESLLPTVLPHKSPVISVMPPTVSDVSTLSHPYSSDSDSDEFHPSPSIIPEEITTPSEDQGPENLPLLSVLGNLGIRDDERSSEAMNSEHPDNTAKSS